MPLWLQHDMKQEDRDKLGQLVREIWISWAVDQPNPKPSWLVPWEELSEADKEVDRMIGEKLFLVGFRWAVMGKGLAKAFKD